MTATQIWLLVFLWIGNQWVPGWKVDGFYPMEQETLDQCFINADYISQQPKQRVFFENGDMAIADMLQGRCVVVYPPVGK